MMSYFLWAHEVELLLQIVLVLLNNLLLDECLLKVWMPLIESSHILAFIVHYLVLGSITKARVDSIHLGEQSLVILVCLRL